MSLMDIQMEYFYTEQDYVSKYATGIDDDKDKSEPIFFDHQIDPTYPTDRRKSGLTERYKVLEYLLQKGVYLKRSERPVNATPDELQLLYSKWRKEVTEGLVQYALLPQKYIPLLLPISFSDTLTFVTNTKRIDKVLFLSDKLPPHKIDSSITILVDCNRPFQYYWGKTMYGSPSLAHSVPQAIKVNVSKIDVLHYLIVIGENAQCKVTAKID